MRGKQSRDIYFENKHHMDVLLDDTRNYGTDQDPYYTNSISFCDYEKSVDPTKEETKNKLNKLEYLWRKIYDDSWLDDSRYFVITDNWYEFAWEQWYNTGFNIFFPHYNTFEHGGTGTNYNTRRMYSSIKNGLVVYIRDSRWSGYSGPFDTTQYDDFIDGTRYDFSDNPRLHMQFTQNGIDFYPFFLGKNTSEGPLATYESCYIASTGVYLYVKYGSNGVYSDNYHSFVYIPYTLHNDASKKITIGEPRYMGTKIDKYLRPSLYNPDSSSGVNYIFTIKQYIFMLSREYMYQWVSEDETKYYEYLIITRLDPEGNVKRVNLGYAYNYNLAANDRNVVHLNDKVYIPLRYWPEDLRNMEEGDTPILPEFWYMWIDENCSYFIPYHEPMIFEWVGGYYRFYVYPDRFESLMASNPVIFYDKNSEYFYIYNMVSSRSKAFPAGGPDDPEFKRLIIAKTKDFFRISYQEPANRYILIHNNDQHWNTLAVCFDTRLDEQLREQYPTTYIISDYGNIEENGSGAYWRCSFHNEKPEHPGGIFNVVRLSGYGDRSWYNGMVYYIADPNLLPSENDRLYSVWEYNEDYPSNNRTLKSLFANNLINKLHGL